MNWKIAWGASALLSCIACGRGEYEYESSGTAAEQDSADVLPAPGDVGSLQQGLRLKKIGGRHTHSKIGMLQITQASRNAGHQGLILRQATMHFPIANNQLTTHFFTHEICLILTWWAVHGQRNIA